MAVHTLEKGLPNGTRHLQQLSEIPSLKYPSLFSPDTDEEFSDGSSSDLEDITYVPLLRINEVIKEPPKTLSAALDILLPRLKPNPDVKGVSIEDQESFVSILVGELGSQFSVLHHQIDDPFLDSFQNKTLHREVSVEVCKIIEQLYGEFIYKAARLSHSALSLSSSMCQLRAQLMIEANTRLNIPAIRYGVLKRLRGPIVSKSVVERYCSHTHRLPPIPKPQVIRSKVSQRPGTDLDELELGAPLEAKQSRFGVKWEADAVRRRIRKLETRLPAVPVTLTYSDDEMEEEAPSWRESRSTKKSTSTTPTDDTTHDGSRYPVKLRRISSNPELYGDFLLCDLGYFTRQKRPGSVRAKEEVLGLHRPSSVGEFLDLKLSEEDSQVGKTVTTLGDYTPHELSDDLHCLEQQRSVSQQSFTEDDLHPLLQAHVHGLSHKQAARLAAFEASMRKEEKLTTEGPCSSGVLTPLEHSIPSVPTMDQLPYLNIEHASDSGSSNPSLHVKSGLPKKELADSSEATFVSSSIRRFGSPSSGYMDNASGQLTSHSNIGSRHSSSQYLDQESLGGCGSGQGTSAGGTSRISLREASSPASELQTSEVSSPQPSMVADIEKVWKDNMLGMGSGLLPPELEEAASRVEDVSGVQPQTAVVTVQCPGQGIVRTTDVRVSERTPLMQVRQKFFGPIYNELAEDWDSSTTEDLDSSMYQGKEITAVYEEIMKTLPTGHLNFSNEPTLEQSLETPVKLSKILASRTLNHRRTWRIINQSLRRKVPPPWGSGLDKQVRKAWEESTEYKGPDIELHQQGAGRRTPYPSEISHNYNTWLSNWKTTINPEDFFKYTSRKETDYLRLVYHLYDSEGSDSEDEAEHKERRVKLAALQAKQREREVRKKHRYRAKSLYESGMWNVNTVTMGGLGEDPGSTSSSDEEEEKENLKKLNEKASNLETVQKNLQQIWTRLVVPSSQQIDMAIKYSGEITQTQLNKVLNLWENACDVIEKREAALLQLESFERIASDPSRFFAKGPAGSATVRLSEARKRDRLHSGLDKLDKQVSSILQTLQKESGDRVTYKGRPYVEKMRLDRTEMLYWLQQARRQTMLRPSASSLTLNEAFSYSSHVSKKIPGH